MSKNTFKRIVSIMLLMCMMLTLVACKSKETGGGKAEGNDSGDKQTGVLMLPYSREDGTNPFTCQSLINNALMNVLFSGLFDLSESYEPEPDIAKSGTVEGTVVTVDLDSSRKFSDGSTITADDVVYSFNKAKASTYYGTSLSNVASARATNTTTVIFDTGLADKYALSYLVFPIVKENTAEDAKANPIGSGYYTYSDTTEGGELSRNKFKSADSYKMEKVTLINTNDSEYLMYSLVIGNFNAVFDDLASGKSQRMNASTAQVALNNLVFLGINQRGVLADPKYREYLGASISRDDLVSAGLEGYGVSTSLPFNPSWYAISKVKERKYNTDMAKEYVAQGAPKGGFNILVNADNNFKVKLAETLCTQLNTLGIKTTLNSVPFAAYSSAVASGSYDIYIGEYKLTNDMNISSLINDEELLNLYAEMLVGNVTVDEFITMFNDKQLFIPIGFRNGVLAYSRNVGSEVKTLPDNPYANLYDWFI